MSKKKIAIIGGGISGLTAAYLLSRKHDITLFESQATIGGHTATKDVHWQGRDYAIDTGFIVFNNWTYPNFQKLLSQIGVAYKPTSMGFSVSNDLTGIEYSGNSLNTLFAQRKNIFNLEHWQMLRDILRFNKQALADLEAGAVSADCLLGEYLNRHHYGKGFIHHYLIPMGAAIWSASVADTLQFPLVFFVRFFKNHGLLSVSKRPQWYVIEGGSRNYLAPLIKPFKDKIRTEARVNAIARLADTVTISTEQGDIEHFDEVVVATHSDQALSLLKDPSDTEQQVLGDIAYRENDVVLHTDDKLLPACKRTWSSWNYRIKATDNQKPVLTYNMNILQGISAPVQFCVTLNDTESIDPEKIIGRYRYAHPVFSLPAVDAQAQWARVNGVRRTWFCGAYWHNGFHEDGVKSALKVAQQFAIEL